MSACFSDYGFISNILLPERIVQCVDLSSGDSLSHTDQDFLPQLWKEAGEGKTANDFSLLQVLQNFMCGFRAEEHEFVEEWCGKAYGIAADCTDLPGCVVGLLRILFSRITQAVASHCREINRRHQRIKSLISTDIRSRFFATNMLFTCRQCQDVSAPTFLVLCQSGQAARNLPLELFTDSE